MVRPFFCTKCGLDAETGDPKWACTTDSINSQSPALISIEGKKIVLAAGGENLTGVTINGGEAPDSTDWSSWRNRFGKIVAMFESMVKTDSK